MGRRVDRQHGRGLSGCTGVAVREGAGHTGGWLAVKECSFSPALLPSGRNGRCFSTEGEERRFFCVSASQVGRKSAGAMFFPYRRGFPSASAEFLFRQDAVPVRFFSRRATQDSACGTPLFSLPTGEWWGGDRSAACRVFPSVKGK